MEQESIYKPKVAIIGAGPAGCMCAIKLGDACDVTIFDISKPLKTLLPTGGGRCNFAHDEFDFKELVHNYPRGEKFLYSIFSRFSTQDTLDFFESIGVDYYTQDDGRIFPKTNSAVFVRAKMLENMRHSKFIQEKVIDLTKNDNNFIVTTANGKYNFDYVVVAVGTHFGTKLLNNLPHSLSELRPALCGLLTTEDFSTLKGVSLKGVMLSYKKVILEDDIIFTDNGISGPLIFKISSINSREKFPYTVKLNFLPSGINLEDVLYNAKNKDLKNVLSEIFPKSFVNFILKRNKILGEIKCRDLNTNTLELVRKAFSEFAVGFKSARKGGETVFSGGISLDEINSNFESKLIEKLYFCGEILDIDGFCGGYNLQNCWSSGALSALDILETM